MRRGLLAGRARDDCAFTINSMPTAARARTRSRSASTTIGTAVSEGALYAEASSNELRSQLCDAILTMVDVQRHSPQLLRPLAQRMAEQEEDEEVDEGPSVVRSTGDGFGAALSFGGASAAP